jgi:TRAP-type C4-dicarboxylate transport system substrate-binding protein
MDEYKGIKPLFMHTTEGYVLHSNKSVKTLEDLKGMKIRSATRINAKLIASRCHTCTNAITERSRFHI